MVLISGVPNILAGIIITFFLTETPKFLFVHGRQAESIEILKYMYHKNTGNPAEDYPVRIKKKKIFGSKL